MFRITASLSPWFFIAALSSTVLAEPYARKSATLRASPSPTAKAVDGVDADQSVTVLESKDSWVRARLGVDVVGWLPADVLSDTWIKVWKRLRLQLEGADIGSGTGGDRLAGKVAGVAEVAAVVDRG
jgi:hypothetical protein